MDWLYWAFCLALLWCSFWTSEKFLRRVLMGVERVACLSGIYLLVPAPAAGSSFWVIEQQDALAAAGPGTEGGASVIWEMT